MFIIYLCHYPFWCFISLLVHHFVFLPKECLLFPDCLSERKDVYRTEKFKVFTKSEKPKILGFGSLSLIDRKKESFLNPV